MRFGPVTIDQSSWDAGLFVRGEGEFLLLVAGRGTYLCPACQPG